MPTAARPRPTEMSVGGIAMITKITMNTPNVARTWVRHSGYSRQPNPALGRWSPMVSTSTGCLHGLNQERRHHEPQQPEHFQVQFCESALTDFKAAARRGNRSGLAGGS